MAIRNNTDVAGGLDWVNGETLITTDLNDTYNKIATLVNTGN